MSGGTKHDLRGDYSRAGANYVFLREGYGRMWGFMWGWVEFFVIRSASLAALATIFAESLHDVPRGPWVGICRHS